MLDYINNHQIYIQTFANLIKGLIQIQKGHKCFGITFLDNIFPELYNLDHSY